MFDANNIFAWNCMYEQEIVKVRVISQFFIINVRTMQIQTQTAPWGNSWISQWMMIDWHKLAITEAPFDAKIRTAGLFVPQSSQL